MIAKKDLLVSENADEDVADLNSDVDIDSVDGYLHVMFWKILSSIGELIILIGVIVKGQTEFRELTTQGWRDYFSSSGSGFLENVVSLSFCTMILGVTFLRIFQSPYEDALLSLASVLAWMYMLFFFLGFRLTGPFVVMIYEMLIADFRRFGTIFVIFLFGFSEAFYIIFNESGFYAFLARIKACFVAMLGAFEFDDYSAARYPPLSIALLLIYVVVVTILLLNLLIAMMGDTFQRISEDADKKWHLEWARIIFSIENEMSPHERLDPANQYWTTVNGNRYLQVQEVNANHFKKTKKKKNKEESSQAEDDKKKSISDESTETTENLSIAGEKDEAQSKE